MYSPKHYQIEQPELAFEVIKNHEFATLISTGASGMQISHLPLLLETNNSELVGHCARANPHWQHFTPGNPITVLFHGPHSYISPAWYKPKPDNVPTWNYVAVHVVGEASVIEDCHESYKVVQRLSDHHEKRNRTGWSLPANSEKILGGLVRGIVSFRIRVQNIQAKFKLSQKQDSEERAHVVRGLREFGGTPAELATWMEKI